MSVLLLSAASFVTGLLCGSLETGRDWWLKVSKGQLLKNSWYIAGKDGTIGQCTIGTLAGLWQCVALIGLNQISGLGSKTMVTNPVQSELHIATAHRSLGCSLTGLNHLWSADRMFGLEHTTFILDMGGMSDAAVVRRN